MLRKYILGLMVALCIPVCVLANEEQLPELVFEPVGGGYFLYCNNPEAIMDDTLADSDNPRYVMNNENLGPGKYYIYLSHYNYIGGGEKPGSDMELDVELTPVSGECSYTISNAAFETTRTFYYYDEEKGYNVFDQSDWGLLKCCATAMDKTILRLDGERVYEPENSRFFKIDDTETRWLSEFIPNYDKVHYRDPVHIQAILEIKSGTMNVNVCAFKSDGELRDRSDFRPDAEFGIHRYDRMVKGIADTLPQVVAKLEYTIDDTVPDGEYLPVSMHNQFAPDGVINWSWVTNINPISDPYALARGDESGMISLLYQDDSKLSFYGKNVPESERDNIWRFDTKHSDTHKYEGQTGTTTADKYSPNYPMRAEHNVGGSDFACCLGNYGVTYTYDLTVTNNGEKTRYFTFDVTTASPVIVYTDYPDKESRYAFLKNRAEFFNSPDIMSVVELLPGKTTDFKINLTLPVNYNGGVQNSFIIKDYAEMPDVEEIIEKNKNREYKPLKHTGKYLSEYADVLPKETLNEFAGKLDCYEILNCIDYYSVRWCAWDYVPGPYFYGWDICTDVYILDKNFNIKYICKAETLPVDITYNSDVLYLKTTDENIYSYCGGTKWEKENFTSMPEDDNLLGEFLDDRDEREHYIKLFDTSVSLSDKEFENFYNEFKNTELVYLGEYPSKNILIDDFDIFSGEFSLEDETQREYLYEYLHDLFYFRDFNTTKSLLNLSDWSYNDIKTACGYGLGFFSETTAKIDYQRGITRKEFCGLISKILEKYSVDVDNEVELEFSDTDDENIDMLVNLGIISGYTDGTFRPDNLITRSEAAVILSRLIGVFELSDTAEIDYSDNSSIPDWAIKGVETALNYGIMKGTDNNLFDPEGIYTIEQSVVTMLRAFNCIENKS